MKAGVFFGGGAFIALHAGYSIGPLANTKFDRVYGVSAGALWAVILAFLGPTAGIQVLSTILNTGMIFVSKDDIAEAGDLLFRGGDGFLLGYGPLRKFIKEKITGLPTMPVTVGRVNNNTMRLQHVTANPDGTFSVDYQDPSWQTISTLDDFLDAVLSSCLTYPIVDMFVDRNGQLWQDGGFREGGPVVRAILDGCTEIHCCLTTSDLNNLGYQSEGGDPLNCMTRTMLGMANQNVLGSVNDAISNPALTVSVYKASPQGSSNVFDQADIQANIKNGQSAVAIPGSQFKLFE